MQPPVIPDSYHSFVILNRGLRHIAIAQARYHPPAREFLQRRRAGVDTKIESIRALKRLLSDVVYRALSANASCTAPPSAITAPVAHITSQPAVSSRASTG